MLHRELLVAGYLVSGSSTEPVVSPWDARQIGTASVGGRHETEAALEVADRASTSWRRSSVRERQGLLRRVAELLRGQSEALARLLVDEIGKPITLARGEILRAALTFDLAADELTRPSGEILPADFDARGDNVTVRTGRFPVGVVLCITPYNWPFNLAAHKVAAALAAGNTVVVKVPTLAPLCGLALGHILDEVGCPPGVANVVHCSNELAEAMVKDARVSLVSFTGSERIGRHIQATVPHKPVLLELGGDAYALVGPDADLEAAAKKTALSAYGYAGQVCISTQHVRCHESVFADFRDLLVRECEEAVTGDPGDEATVCGPLINSSAADRVLEWFDEAEAGGAKILAGGHRSGNTVWPTLLADVPPGVKVSTEEVFGPVATLAPFETWSEAFAMANASRFGLQAGVFTSDIDVAEAAFQYLEVGGVVVNDSPSLRFDNMPYGGDKESGNTREGLRYAIDAMTRQRVQVMRHTPPA